MQQAKAYQKIKQTLALWNLVYTPLLLVFVIGSPLSRVFQQGIPETSSSWFKLLLYFLYLSCFILVCEFPISFYSGHIVEHRFKLSNQSVSQWFVDFVKAALIQFVVSAVLLQLLYLFLNLWPTGWWIAAWMAFMGFSYLLGRIFPTWLVPLFFKYAPIGDAVLEDKIRALCKRFDLPLDRVYSLDLSRKTKKANAAFMGFGASRRLVLSDTLLAHFPHEEIEMVVAHELGHFKHKDMLRMFIASAISSFFVFWAASWVLNLWLPRLPFPQLSDYRSLPYLFFVLTLLQYCLIPIQSSFSRISEYAADRFAVDALPFPNHFKSCMERLAQINLADPDPNPIYEWFFYDHPSIRKRIRSIEAAATK